MDKNALRKEVRKRKSAYSKEELIVKSEPIIGLLKQHSKVIKAKTILLYHSLPDEVYTHNLIEELIQQGKKILLPVVVSDTEMEVRAFHKETLMATSNYNISEPIGEKFTDYPAIDVIVVPGMGFDEQNNRLGRGKGYYDRFLSLVPNAYKIGICFDFQKFKTIPNTPLDFKVDEVL